MELTVEGTVQLLLPLDVYTRDGAEWLRAQNKANEELIVRLDRLTF